VLKAGKPVLLNNAFVNTAKPGKFTPLCSAPSETHLKESTICATSLRTHLAHEHLQFYDGIPGQVKAMCAHQTCCRWGHTAMRSWGTACYRSALPRRWLALGVVSTTEGSR
jgi:hypothetical protein